MNEGVVSVKFMRGVFSTDWFNYVINRPGLAGAVVHTALSATHSLDYDLPPESLEHLKTSMLQGTAQLKNHIGPCWNMEKISNVNNIFRGQQN